MNSSMISEIAKAKRYAEEPERIQFTRFEATFRGERDIHTTNYDNGEWHCTCRFFHTWGDCSHTMAMQRVLGVTIPAAHRHNFPANQKQQKEPEQISTAMNIQDLRIRITEMPLTPQNLTTIVTALTELYTKCWLIVRRRFADLIEYAQTRDRRFVDEASLVISKVMQNSPLNIDLKMDASPQGLMIALGTGIDAITMAPHRIASAALENQTKELANKLKALETQSELADKSQARMIAAQKAELDKQTALLEIEKQRLELMARRLEVEKMRIDYALQIAGNMMNFLHPNADEETRTLLIQTLMTTLLQLGEAKGLELVYPMPLARTAENT
jgi:hypothetical protein